jgi:hypothetical protein
MPGFNGTTGIANESRDAPATWGAEDDPAPDESRAVTAMESGVDDGSCRETTALRATRSESRTSAGSESAELAVSVATSAKEGIDRERGITP